MNSAEKEAVLHCLKSMIDEAVCEECPLYGTTGTDHCEKDCVRLAINALEQVPCTDAISREDALQALCKAVHKNDDTIPCLNQRVSCLWDKTKVQDYAEEILKLPPVKPQYTDAEIQKMQDLEFAEIQKAYEIGKAENIEVLDKIRAEIDEQYDKVHPYDISCAEGLEMALEIIDKYKANPTGAEGSDKE